jgi:hypothetical protein
MGLNTVECVLSMLPHTARSTHEVLRLESNVQQYLCGVTNTHLKHIPQPTYVKISSTVTNGSEIIADSTSTCVGQEEKATSQNKV